MLTHILYLINIEECSDDTCEQICEVNDVGKARCSCEDGYQLADDKTSCEDIDECETGQDNCDQDCENTEGGFKCSCHTGELDTDRASCVEVNPCDTENGHCEDLCVHIGHREAVCTCENGLLLDTDMRSCVSPCEVENGGCSPKAECELVNEIVQCTCPSGSVMDDEEDCVGKHCL